MSAIDLIKRCLGRKRKPHVKATDAGAAGPPKDERPVVDTILKQLDQWGGENAENTD